MERRNLALLCAGVLLAVVRAALPMVLLGLLAVALFVVLSAAVGLVLGVLMPSFHWTSETAVIKQSPFCLLAMLLSWGAALALFAGTGLPLIVEVKSFRDNFAELTERTMAELDKFDVKYCVESFDPRCVVWLKKHRPEVIRGQLSCDFLKDRGNLSLPMAFATTNLLGNIMAQPDFVAYKFEDKKNWAPRLCRKLYGAQGVYWTIRSKEDLETAEREGAIAIFERFIP